jgi:hypothetical protein
MIALHDRSGGGETVRRILLLWAGALALCFHAAIPARAAEIEVLHVDPSGIALIGVSGEFNMQDGRAFAAVAARFRQAVIAFSSPGGALIAGLQMGQIIRLRHFATFSPEGAMCASACAIAWLAGTPRFMQAGSKIGFHAAFDRNTHEQTGVGNALVGAYLNRLGLTDKAIIYIEQAAPDEITWLTPEDAREMGIAVSLLPSFPQPRHPRPAEPAPAPVPATKPAEPAPPPAHLPRLLPSLVAPTEPAAPAEAGTLEERAKAFAGDYFAHWSETNGQALGYFAAAYAAKVVFYGQKIDRPTLLQQKRAYAERWPVRVYSARPDSVRAFCNPATNTCVITGIVDWDCRSEQRNARSTGSANFSLTVSFDQGQRQILAEAGSVISRKVE